MMKNPANNMLPAIFRAEAITNELVDKGAAVQEQMARMARQGLVLETDVTDKKILDWECGKTVHSAFFVHAGARLVVATDSYPMWPAPHEIFHPPQNIFQYREGTLSDALADMDPDLRFDLCFSNTASEHIDVHQLRENLQIIGERLTPRGVLFINHDNYYSPMGAHDNALKHSPENYREIVPAGPACWEHGDCAASTGIREYLHTHVPHPSDRNSPPTSLRIEKGEYASCSLCPYFKRSQLWAHLLHEEEFLVLRGTWHRDCLNKLRPDQLLAMLDECGFKVVRRQALVISQKPPARLLSRFSLEELTSTTVKLRCVKK